MDEIEYFTKSYTVDSETFSRLEKLAKELDRPMSWVIRSLVNAAWEKRYSKPNPFITVSEAQSAAEQQGR